LAKQRFDAPYFLLSNGSPPNALVRFLKVHAPKLIERYLMLLKLASAQETEHRAANLPEIHPVDNISRPALGGRRGMILRKGQRYRCQNRECGAEIEALRDSIEGQSNPVCCCGGEMKKPYRRPLLKTYQSDAAVISELFKSRA